MASEALIAQEAAAAIGNYEAASTSSSQQPVVLSPDISEAAADLVSCKLEKPGLQFVANPERPGRGQLISSKDPDEVHERVSRRCALLVCNWMEVAELLSLTGLEDPLLENCGSTRRTVQGGVRKEPDESFFLRNGFIRGVSMPNLVIEVGFSETDPSIQHSVQRWVRPAGPSCLAIGIKVEYPVAPGQPPEIRVHQALWNLSNPPVVQCGRHSTCLSRAMYDWQLWLPVDLLLHGAPARVRFQMKLALALMACIYSVGVGNVFAVRDVLCCRRTCWEVLSASFRSLMGPWWGVLPIDLFFLRRAAYDSEGFKVHMR